MDCWLSLLSFSRIQDFQKSEIDTAVTVAVENYFRFGAINVCAESVGEASEAGCSEFPLLEGAEIKRQKLSNISEGIYFFPCLSRPGEATTVPTSVVTYQMARRWWLGLSASLGMQ